MTHWWKNKDECVDSWMVPVQMMLFWSRRWLLRTWVAWNLVTPNMVDRNLDTLEHGYYEVTWNPVTPIWLCSTMVIATTPNMVAWNLVTPNMVDRNLDTLKHGYYEVTSNPVTPLWLCSTLMIATTANMVWNLITPNMVDGNLDSLWTWLLRSYLEPCYTNMVVLNIGGRKCVIIFHLLHFQQILSLTFLGAILRMYPPGETIQQFRFWNSFPRGRSPGQIFGES